MPGSSTTGSVGWHSLESGLRFWRPAGSTWMVQVQICPINRGSKNPESTWIIGVTLKNSSLKRQNMTKPHIYIGNQLSLRVTFGAGLRSISVIGCRFYATRGRASSQSQWHHVAKILPPHWLVTCFSFSIAKNGARTCSEDFWRFSNWEITWISQ